MEMDLHLHIERQATKLHAEFLRRKNVDDQLPSFDMDFCRNMARIFIAPTAEELASSAERIRQYCEQFPEYRSHFTGA